MKARNCAHVPFPGGLVPIYVITRRNRFTVEASLVPEGTGPDIADQLRTTPAAREAGARYERSPVALHLPNSGRMTELLETGTLGLAQITADLCLTGDRRLKDGGGHGADADGRLADGPARRADGTARQGDCTARGADDTALRADGTTRRTAGTLLLVRYAGRWVSVDARMPNRLFARCLEKNCLPPFQGYTAWRPEVRWGHSRVDFLLEAPGRPPCLVETKSCNLVEDGLALFPDAPTARGTRHLLELAAAVQQGLRAAVVWFVQRDDASALAAHRVADPDFAQALVRARAAGVEAYAYRCRVEPEGITVLDEIPVKD